MLSIVNSAASVRATETLLYSFEVGTDGFASNGGGVYTQDTIGATDGQHSLKVFSIGGPGFFGGLTTTLPTALGDPPGIDYISFDMTLTSEYGAGQDPGFAVVGVTIFGKTQADPNGAGLQAQFDDIEHIDGKAAGTYHVQIDLNSAPHPLTNAYPQTFDQIFGTLGSGPNDLIPSGFEFFFNKNASLDYPMTVYIDNVRAGINSAALAGDYNGDGKVNAADYVAWRKGVSPNPNTIGDYNTWRGNFGASAGLGSSLVPEPAVAWLVLMGAAAFGRIRRVRTLVG